MRRNRPDSVRITPEVLVHGAIDFADLADVYAARRKPPLERSPVVLAFIIGRSLELALKAILRKDGASLSCLRYEISHNIELAYQKVISAHSNARLRLTPRRKAALSSLGHYYTAKTLEYTEVGAYELPPEYVLRGLLKELICYALDHIYGAGTAARQLNYGRKSVGISIATDAVYGNTSRRQALKRLQRAFERLAAD